MLQREKRVLVMAVLFALMASPIVFGFNPNTDPSLVGWWPFNDGSGTTAVDASGHGNNGTLVGNPQWVTGRLKGALSFDGNGDYVDCGNGPTLDIRDQITMAFWIKTSGFTTDWSGIITKGDGAWRMSRAATTGNAIHMGFGGTTTNGNQYLDGTIPVTDGEWHFCAGVYDGAQVRIYVDNVLDVSQNATGQLASATYDVLIGENAQMTGRYLNGTLDDVRVYNRGLTLDELQQVMTGGIDPAMASDPSPVDGETDVALDSILTWTSGDYAVTHDVYFGADFNDVNEASRTDPRGVLVSQGQSAASYAPSGLALDQTYYWRVDEVNKPSDNKIYKGITWSFTAEPTYIQVVPTMAIASSNAVDSGPEKTIDGSGLNDMDQHSTDITDMWVNSGDDPNGTWIQYNFDTAYKLSKMLVWNSNQAFESILGMGVKDANVEVSLDGVNWTNVAGDPLRFAQASGQATYTANTTVDLGDTIAKYVRINVLSHWSLLPTVTQVSLSEVRFMAIPAAARRPEPASGGSLASLTDQLVWRAGRGAVQHQLYIDMNEAKVMASDSSVLVSTQTARRYDLSNDTNLLYAETYYWKVDENDGNEVVAGPVWEVNTPPYLVVDSMDSYNDTDNLIYDAWVDGYNDNTNGSQVGYLQAPFAEQSIVFAGQSMPFSYNNSGSVTQSTATLDLGGQNWSRGGGQTLVFYFLGDRDNDDATLFVTVDGKEVDLTNSLSAGLWTQENIDLASLGINLSNVGKLTIGVKGSGSGILYIDEVRVYREAPAVVTPVDPGNTGLVLDYEMDNSVADSSGNGLDGTVQGAPLYLASLTTDMGQALQFDGLENYVDVPIGDQITGWTDCSISAWVNIDPTSTGSWQRVFDFGTGTTNYLFLSPRSGTNGPARVAILDPNFTAEFGVTSSKELTDGWHHVACVFTSGDPNGTLTLYVDGWSAGTVETAIYPKDLGATTQNWLGQSQWSGDSLLMGLLDQFRIYNRALSAGEIRYLAGDR